ncbi:MAG: toll/interleukin-1 receptor domain-containing protein [Gammaproteobacteria bacterium]|nr:MAG: toll/interleukin-1 receptor domain-containing protein [Gammaproteobacteria bacterium]RLA50812.1 MAG: toll/interleukin-1 receptor domain-containing protein [Gammaproteobacteria bacterium]
MNPIYRIVVFGSIDNFDGQIREAIAALAGTLDLAIGIDIEILMGDESFSPLPIATVGLFVGGGDVPVFVRPQSVRSSSPVIPIVSFLTRCSAELPPEVSHVNAMEYSGADRPAAIASAVMECLGLLPKQRRVFLSYRREKSREAALQLFDKLSARQFDVFLDTHDVRPGETFQEVLWHRLCESDVMIMLDTADYFGSRWTREEFGKASYKRAAILRVGWPGVDMVPGLAITDNVQLRDQDITRDNCLKTPALEKICQTIEGLRSKSIAVRYANLAGTIDTALREIGAKSEQAGPMRRFRVTLPRGKTVLAYPTIGVPSAEVLNDIADDADGEAAVLIYDAIGVMPRWCVHLDWLGDNIPLIRWMKLSSVGWDFTAWDSE